MGFAESLRTCFGKYAKFDGRASRPEFWYFYLFCFIYMFVAGFLLGMTGASDAASGGAILILMIPIFIPSIAVAARRLHDINQSGWMQCIFIPGYVAAEMMGMNAPGWIIWIGTTIVFAIFLSQKADKKKNKFGTVPKK